MAYIYPTEPLFQTAGEERVFTFLKDHLSDAWHIFHEPLVNDTSPDIVLFSPYAGTLIIEVKDYTTQTLQTLTPNYWGLSVEGQQKSVLSPYEQARHYKHKLSENLQSKREFCVETGRYQGKLMFPVMCAVWMVNISSHDAKVINMSKVIPDQYLLVRDNFDEPERIEQTITEILVSKFRIIEIPYDVTSAFVKLMHPVLIVPEFDALRQAWFESFKPNIKAFPSVVDEVLHIATEIRHLLASGIALSSIRIYTLRERFLQRASLVEETQQILASMGVTGLKFANLNMIEELDEKQYSFIMDIHLEAMDELKEATLSKLLSVAYNRVSFSSSSL
ncbi:nuclease-related domain-containing protein [Cohnella sp. GCM10012308]|uniref:nuclease-related domain-containing protein n=1 Tax=Cohnella sp. GCM10012308 TaxID=3317329 RepID=UPI003613F42C